MILILDFGSQYTHLIARRIREQHVYCEVHPCTISLAQIKKLNPSGLLLSGGPSSVHDPDSPLIDSEIFTLGIPILGICYGLQLMVHLLGGKIESAKFSEYGPAPLTKKQTNSFLTGFLEDKTITVWMSHGDQVVSIPKGFEVLAESPHSPYAIIASPQQRLFGLQFHPEVVHTENGNRLLQNFLFHVCRLRPTWNMDTFFKEKIQSLRREIGNKKVLCALSGGVDSSVVAVLLHQAIREQLTCVFVDNGLLRKDEATQVIKTFRDHYPIHFIHIDAKDRFLSKLEGVSDPEQKRKIIGNEFIAVFEREADKLRNIEFLAQGTLYPDVIESVSFKGPSVTIKSHHNVGGLPEKMKLSLVEPLRELFKDEVRLLGLQLGLPEKMIYRQPFPGPGLAVRILGPVTTEKIQVLQNADAIVTEEIEKAGLYRKIWQSFAVLLPVKTVGVMGDRRTFEWVLAIRSVDSTDAMTGDWTRLPYEVLAQISNRIINEIPRINRVVYDITSKPPGTIEWE